MQLNEKAAQIMEHLVTCSKHGYTQGNRWGDGKSEKIKLSDGTQVTIATGDRDCSSAVISAYKAAGLNVNATYTGNMKNAFLATGLFEWKPMSFSAQRGDIYLNEGNHTAMCVSPYGSKKGDILAEFSISENGTIYGRTGDQTGRESLTRAYYDYPWNGILHFKGGTQKTTATKTAEKTTPAKKPNTQKVDIVYRLFAKNSGWLPKVKNFNNKTTDGYAGAKGAMHTAFEATVSRGSIKYRVHSPNGGWSAWEKDGKTAKGEPWIDGVQLYYTTVPGEPYKQAWYRSGVTTTGNYLAVCCDDGTVTKAYDSWAGLYGIPMDRLQIAITNASPF